MNQEIEKTDIQKRQQIIKALAVSGAAVAAWHKPIINSVILPAHAQTTGGAGSGDGGGAGGTRCAGNALLPPKPTLRATLGPGGTSVTLEWEGPASDSYTGNTEISRTFIYRSYREGPFTLAGNLLNPSGSTHEDEIVAFTETTETGTRQKNSWTDEGHPDFEPGSTYYYRVVIVSVCGFPAIAGPVRVN